MPQHTALETRKTRIGSLSIALALLLVACGSEQFSAVKWQRDIPNGEEDDPETRRLMVRSVKNRFPAGSNRSEVLTELGTPDLRCEPANEEGISSCGWATAGNEKIVFYFRASKVTGSRVGSIS